jgi:ComF family protein
MQWRAGAFELLASLVAPPRCAACDVPVRRAIAFCPPCARTLVRADNPDPSRIAAFVYGGAIAETLRRCKFEGRPDLARVLAAGFSPHLRDLESSPRTLLIPVPLHPSRLVERGYNQAALLAGSVARRIDAEWAPRGLCRRRQTTRQTELDRSARASNVRDAFSVADPSALSGRSIILVDDVETTGATLGACRAALERCDILGIRSLVVARAGG